MSRIFVVALFAVAAACGGKSSAPAHRPDHAGSASGSPTGPLAGHEGEHDDLSPEMKKFHDAFAPRWHAEKGPKRMPDACAAVPEFQTAADGVATATPPATTNADTWTAATRALVAAVTKLGEACKTSDASKFESAFAAVHDAFHSLMKQAGMHESGDGRGTGTGGGSGAGPGHHHE